jgi:hypothetical protein
MNSPPDAVGRLAMHIGLDLDDRAVIVVGDNRRRLRRSDRHERSRRPSGSGSGFSVPGSGFVQGSGFLVLGSFGLSTLHLEP